jgi:hypothetical protein
MRGFIQHWYFRDVGAQDASTKKAWVGHPLKPPPSATLCTWTGEGGGKKKKKRRAVKAALLGGRTFVSREGKWETPNLDPAMPTNLYGYGGMIATRVRGPAPPPC